MMLRRAIKSAVLFSAMVFMAGCQDDEQLTLRLANWADHSEIKIVDAILKEFERRNPGVLVKQESYPNQYREKLIASFAAGTAPDVFLFDSVDIPTFADRGLALDLKPYMARVGFNPDDYFPNVLEIAMRNGKLYAFPKDFTPMVIFYNKDVLRKNGVPFPRSDWTWNDFVQACLALRKDFDDDGKLDQYGSFFLRQLYQYQPFLWNNGGDILSPDGARASGFLNSPETVEAFRFLIDWHNKWDFTGPLNIKRNPTHRDRNVFYLGKAGFLLNGHWWLPEVKRYVKKRDLEIGVVGLPRVPGKKYQNVMYESGWAVSVATQRRKHAVKLAAFMSGEFAQRLSARRGLAISAMKRVAEEIAEKDSTGLEKIFLEEVAFARQPWGAKIPDFSTIDDLLKQVFDRTVWGDEKLELVIDDVTRKIDALLRERRLQADLAH